MSNNYFTISILLLLLTTVRCQTPQSQEECVNNPGLDTSTNILMFFNGCYRYYGNRAFGTDMALQFIEWFNGETICVVLVALILIIPSVSFGDDSEQSVQIAAKGNVLRLKTLLILWRIGLAYTLSSAMQAFVKQDTPCLCRTDPTQPYVAVGNIWGLPSVDITIVVILGLHILTHGEYDGKYSAEYIGERVGKFFGAFFITIFALFACVELGQASVGQSFSALALAVFIHIYTSQTIILMRFLDLLISMFLGITAFLTAAKSYPNVDYSFGDDFLTGLAWQLFSILAFFILFDFSFIFTKLSVQRPTFIKMDTFLYYSLNSKDSIKIMNKPQRRFEIFYFILLILFHYLVMTSLIILSRDLNTILFK